MPTKRDLREAHEEGNDTYDGELRSPHNIGSLRKAKRLKQASASLGRAEKGSKEDARDHANYTLSNSSRDGDTDTGEAQGDGGTSGSQDDGKLQTDDFADKSLMNSADLSLRDHERAHLQNLAPKSADSQPQANNEVDVGRSDEDMSDKEEKKKVVTPRSGIAKVDTDSDLSESSSRSSSDGESSDEDEELEKRPDDSTAFGRAFQKIMKKKVPSTALTEAMGPMLSAHKKLMTEKLEEAAEGQKAKRKSKKERQALREKGHTVPSPFPSSKDKELLKLATRGVVKLFNAVSKAQSVQAAAVSKDSEAKEVAKQSKSAFLAMLQGGNGSASHSVSMQKHTLNSTKEGVADVQPGWSALQETFMLGKSSLKNWDKEQDDLAESEVAESSGDDSDSSE